MKFICKFKAPVLDLRAYRDKLKNELEDWLKQSGRIWLDATVGIGRELIPTWSKASRATFQQLARLLGTVIPYGPQRSRKDREGLGLATGSGSEIVWGDGPSVHFVYNTTLRYLAYNEYNKAVKGPPPGLFSHMYTPTPYNFTLRGRDAFLEFAQFVTLPNPYRFLKGVKI